MKNIIKKISLSLILIISLIGISSLTTYAEDDKTTTVIVTEKIPGAGCVAKGEANTENGEVQLYECKSGKGFSTVIILLGKIIKYFTFLAGLAGVLFIVLNGIMYSMGGADPSMKDDAKKRIVGTLVGLMLLLLSGVILNQIAPWIWVA